MKERERVRDKRKINRSEENKVKVKRDPRKDKLTKRKSKVNV